MSTAGARQLKAWALEDHTTGGRGEGVLVGGSWGGGAENLDPAEAGGTTPWELPGGAA